MLIALVFACTPELPPSAIDVGASTWPVYGTRASEVRRSLVDDAPEPGTAGVTRVRAMVSCQPGLRDTGVADVSVHAWIEVSTPAWEAPADADPRLLRRWKRFAAAVDAHEQHHVDLAFDRLGGLDAELREAADCDAVFDEARDAAGELDALEDAWDAENAWIRF
jgi:predicted secreted Zn-dependent protease